MEGDQEADWPRAFSSIRINFQIGWEDGFTPDETKVEKALDMACNRYCPVDATLTNGTRIRHSHSSPASGEYP
ncbi:MAG: OsmC family protein [Candidatus Dormibacteraeota bacterium]|uniref:OsmC family protein n=1 Tax=Candidatus Dormiibacter inghamiae TaxID=3127013 RepID=A0A934KJ37_9BACT|nr:OsmC family protein [Candidatus Dormibacteraeota bacterium]MBJ7605293.1 OsmC family protein [Candidatus Dormibacteraeota bacterium]